ncbi:MAG: lactate racemase domain-containing protein, partial [Candidatus Hinthialibacter sp.]
MDIRLAYGQDGLKVRAPDENLAGVIHMNPVKTVSDPEQEIRESLKNPIGCKALSEIAQGRESAVVVISDITRPVPNKILLPPILQTLE